MATVHRRIGDPQSGQGQAFAAEDQFKSTSFSLCPGKFLFYSRWSFAVRGRLVAGLVAFKSG